MKSAADHSQSRGRRIALSTLTGVPAFGVQVGSGLLLVMLAWRALGPEGFGLWSAITALSAPIALGDLGVGNALISLVARAVGRDDLGGARRAAAAAFAVSSAAALLILGVVLVAYPIVDWAVLFNVPHPSEYDLGLCVVVYGLCRLLLLPIGIVSKVRTGLQENFVNSGWDAVAALLSLGLFYLAIRADADLPLLLLASGAGPLIAAIGNWISMLGRNLIPRLEDVSVDEMRPLTRLGMLFFALNLATVLSSAADNLIAVRLLGAAATAELAVANKIVAAGQAVLNVALVPLWPAFAEAIARRDGRWVGRALRLSLAISCAAGMALSAAFLVFANTAVAIWLGTDVSITKSLLWANGFWLVLQANGIVGAMFLNGAGIVRFQVVQALAFGVVAFGLKLALVSPLGTAGIVWATVIAYTVIVLPSYYWFIRRWLARATWK